MSDAVAQSREPDSRDEHTRGDGERGARRKRGKSRGEQLVRKLIRPAMWVVVLMPLATIAYALFFTGLGANPIDELEHLTGRWALRFLAGSLAVTPLIRLTGWGWLIPQRRFLGIAAFVAACVHLSTYVILDAELNVADIFEDVVKRTYITVGFLTFLLLVPLALTSTKASIKRMGGQKWERLHRLVYVAAVTATIHYLWAVKKDVTGPVTYFSVFALLLGFRLVWWSRHRRRDKEAAV